MRDLFQDIPRIPSASRTDARDLAGQATPPRASRIRLPVREAALRPERVAHPAPGSQGSQPSCPGEGVGSCGRRRQRKSPGTAGDAFGGRPRPRPPLRNDGGHGARGGPADPVLAPDQPGRRGLDHVGSCEVRAGMGMPAPLRGRGRAFLPLPARLGRLRGEAVLLGIGLPLAVLQVQGTADRNACRRSWRESALLARTTG